MSATTAIATSSSPRPAPARPSSPRSTTGSSAKRRAATSRCSSSPTARRSCSSRWRPIAPCFATAPSARSTAAAGSPHGRHVFAMVQSLHADRLEQIAPDAFDVVVVDEFHHAAAATYDRLLKHLEPKELLGLTATPERLDGKDVTEWFDQRIAVELRLWEAIDQGFLVPFQYFGVADGTDLQPARLAARRLRDRGAQQRPHQRRPAGREAARGDPADRARPGLDARAGLLRLQGARALHGAQVHARRGSRASRSPATTRPDARRSASRDLAGGTASVRLLRRGPRRGRRRARRRLPAAAAPDRVGDALRAAARPRPAPGGRKEPPHRDRPDRPAPARVSLRGSASRDHRHATRPGRSTRSAATSRSCRPAARSTSTGRAARSSSTTSRRRSGARAGRRSSQDLRSEPDGDDACSTSSSATTTASRTSTAASAAGPSSGETRAIERPRRAIAELEASSLKALGRLTHVDDPERVAFYREVPRASAPPRRRVSTSASGGC